MSLLPDYTEIDRLRAELAKAELHRDTYRDAWQTVAAEIAELRAQKPVAWLSPRTEFSEPLAYSDYEVDDEIKKTYLPLYARPVPAAQSVTEKMKLAVKRAVEFFGQMSADDCPDTVYLPLIEARNAMIAAVPQSPADHVPDDGKTIELLRDIETRYLADLLSKSIAGLGYPVGCGIPPSDDHAMKAAAALFDRFVGIAAAIRKGAQ